MLAPARGPAGNSPKQYINDSATSSQPLPCNMRTVSICITARPAHSAARQQITLALHPMGGPRAPNPRLCSPQQRVFQIVPHRPAQHGAQRQWPEPLSIGTRYLGYPVSLPMARRQAHFTIVCEPAGNVPALEPEKMNEQTRPVTSDGQRLRYQCCCQTTQSTALFGMYSCHNCRQHCSDPMNR
jgi:hypothetical protein